MKNLFSALALFALAMVGAPVAPAAAAEGEVRIAMPTLYAQSFLPQATIGYSIAYQSPVFDFLIATTPEGEFDPSISVAERWSVSDDGLTWNFDIRDGITFHNGDPLTAEDVKFTLDMTVTEQNTAGRRSNFEANLKSVETDGTHKVIVHLKKRWNNFPYFLSDLIGVQGMIIPKNYIESGGVENFLKNPIGSGPYKVAENIENDRIVLELADEDHWRVPSPAYQRIVFRLIPESATRVAALNNDEVDVALVGLNDLPAAKEAGLRIVRKEDGVMIDLSFLRVKQVEDNPLNDARVREALNLAIDRKAILEQILNGEGQQIGTTLALFTWAFDYKEMDPVPFDPERAMSLLAEAGHADGFDMNLYSFVRSVPEARLINEAIAAYWEGIGVRTQILEMDYSAFRPVWMKQKEPPGPAAFTMDWPNRPFYSWRGKYHSTARFSTVGDEKLDEMIEAVEAKVTVEEYIPLSQQIMEYVREQNFASSISTVNLLFAVDPEVPEWETGRSFGSYRFEYIGAK